MMRPGPPSTRSPPSGAVADPPIRLIIPDIGLEAPVVPARLTTMTEGSQVFITWEPPHGFAAGWLPTSAAPGQGGNVVLIGHHNIEGKVFRALHRLRPGQRIRVETSQKAYGYQVEAIHILPEKGQPLEVRQRNLAWILPTPEERLTLVTCWPPENNTHRLIVVARPAP
ncbi:sortase [Thermoflexus hugenholtzii]